MSAQQSGRTQASQVGEIVDAAVRTGRVDARVRNELTSALKSGNGVRALVVTTAPQLFDGQSLEAQREAAAPMKAEIAAAAGVRVENPLPSLNTTVVEISSLEGLASLASMPDATVVADELYKRADSSSEPYVGAPTVLGHGYDGAGTYIGIIDSGADYTHPDLGSCSFPGAPPPCRVALLPRDFSRSFSGGPLYDDGLLDDSIRHGTNVAAIASAMAPASKIIAADVFGPVGAFGSDIASAVQYMIDMKAAGYPIVAVNLSLGLNSSSACVDALGMGALRNAGIIPVAAAGNSAYVNGTLRLGIANPACVPATVSVGATYDAYYGSAGGSSCFDSNASTDRIACFSQTSSLLTMLAPGTFVSGGGVEMSGTSQAAPHVVGALATIASAIPQATPSELIAGLKHSSVVVYDPRIGLSFPRLSVPDALTWTRFLVGAAVGHESFDLAAGIDGYLGSRSTQAGYTGQTGEKEHGRRSGISSTWFRWTAPATGRVTFSTVGSTFDTAMSIYRGSAINALTEVGWNDDSAIGGTAAIVGPLEVTTGTKYRIAVSCGWAASSCGTVNLSWLLDTDTSRPVNDSHTTAVVLTGASGIVTGTNTFAQPQSGEVLQPGGSSAQKSIWYRFDSLGASSVSISTTGSNFDTSLSIYKGPSPMLELVASHNDVGQVGAKFDGTSQVTVHTSRTPAIYWIVVDSPSWTTGSVNLSWASTIEVAPQSAAVAVAPRAPISSGADPVGLGGRRPATQVNPPVVIAP